MITEKKIKSEHYTKIKHKFKEKDETKLDTEKVLIIVFFILDISLSGLIGIVVKYKNLESENIGQRVTLTKFLVPCDDLSLSLYEDTITFDGDNNSFKHFVDADGTNICLFNNLTEIVVKVKKTFF